MQKNNVFFLLILLLFSLKTLHAQHYAVITNADHGHGSLRAAIDSANTRMGPDTIRFNIPDSGSENGIINLQTPLPKITDSGLIILGTAQILTFNEEETFLPNIQIWGSEIKEDSAIGLHIEANNVHIHYLFLIGFRGGGIVFDNTEIGSVSGCYIGIENEDEGDKRNAGNGDGIAIWSSTHIFMGPSTLSPFGNIISGFSGSGISISDSSSFNALIGNEIGFNARENRYFRSGNERHGITISQHSNLNEVIGNKIGQSGMHGIELKEARHNFIVENQIGSMSEFKEDIGNLGSGIYLHDGAQFNEIIRNEVGYNMGYGIVNDGNSTIRNIMSRNLISKNTMGGISNRQGGNSMVAAPEILSHVNQEIRGRAGAFEIIEIFLDEEDQGRIYIDSVVADNAGDFVLPLSGIRVELNITAIARDELGNTSEFSLPFNPNKTTERSVLIVSTTEDTGPGSLRNAIDSSNIRIGPDTIMFNIPDSDAGFDPSKGVWFIKPDSPLPLVIDAGLVIDGMSQVSFLGEDPNPDGPEIVISGEKDPSFAAGLNIQGMQTEVYAITINKYNGPGISIYTPGFATVSGCYIGTNYNGMEAAGNNDGVVLGYLTFNSLIGPSAYHPNGNLISGNKRIGIFMVDSSWHNIIVGNQIGTNQNQTDIIGNKKDGINLARSCHYNEIFDNTIVGNFYGISLFESKYNVIAGNNIGFLGKQLVSGNVGAGIFLWSNSSQNLIINNRIGFNGDYGIYNEGMGTIENIFSKNTFHKNTYGDILNLNGGNLELEPPTNLLLNNRTLSGEAAPKHIIELFTEQDSSGVSYLDSLNTNSEGNFYYIFETIPRDLSILATARDSAGNTSALSEPFVLTTHSTNHKKTSELFTHHYQPNPTSNETLLTYHIPKSEWVGISLFNYQGKYVKKLIETNHQPGTYALTLNLENLSEGVYFSKLWLRNGYQQITKLVVTH